MKYTWKYIYIVFELEKKGRGGGRRDGCSRVMKKNLAH